MKQRRRIACALAARKRGWIGFFRACVMLAALLLTAAADAYAQSDNRANRPSHRTETLIIPDVPVPVLRQQPDGPAAEPKEEKIKAALLYFNYCTEHLLLDQEEDVRTLFCACSADRARAFLTTAQLEALVAGESVDINLTSFTTQIQAPCLSYPLRELEYKRCLFHNSNNFLTQEAHDSMCKCLGSHIAKFVTDYGPSLMSAQLTRSPQLENPMSILSKSRPYRAEKQRIRTACLNAYAYQ